MTKPTIGAQTIIFGKKYHLEKDADVVFGALARAGYAAVETGMADAAFLKSKLDAHHLKHAADHTGARPLAENTQQYINALNITGAKDLCNSGLIDWKHSTVTEVGYSIKLINDAGKKLRDAGIRLHYHNHEFEFQVKILGKRVMDILLDELDPNACDLCVDVAWVLRGGDQPADFLHQHAAKVGYLHFKDYDGSKWVPLGQGKVDFKSIVQVLPELNVQWIMVEQDEPSGDAIDDMTQSRKYLQDTFGL